MLYKLKGHYPKVDATVYIAPGARIIGNVQIGRESSVWFNTVIRGDNDQIRIGDQVNIQDGSVLHVDKGVPLTIGDEVSVGHNVTLHGCTIGRGCLIGMGATILNRAEIGEYVLVAAGSLIPEGKKIPSRTLVMGSPAKVVRELTEEDLVKLQKPTQIYVSHAKLYKSENIADEIESTEIESCRILTDK